MLSREVEEMTIGNGKNGALKMLQAGEEFPR